MDWLSVLAAVMISAGTTITIIVLFAMGSIRRRVEDGADRQTRRIRKLTETVVALDAQLREARERIELLTETDRRLTTIVAAIGERLGETPPSQQPPRVLH